MLLIITCQKFNVEDTPIALIWLPEGENKYGHATLHTDTYHMSLWPDGDVKEDLGVVEAFKDGVKGKIVIHHNLDRYFEDRRDPIQISLKEFSSQRLNRTYERFLAYNNIAPETATLEAGQIMIDDKTRPEIKLKKSLYSYTSNKYWEDDFFEYKQSCATFCMSLLINSMERKPNASHPFLKFGAFLKNNMLMRILFPALNIKPVDNSVLTVPQFKEILNDFENFIIRNILF